VKKTLQERECISTILKYIASVWVEDSTGVLRAVGKLGVGGKGEERVIEG
jgi:hypothetical protein